MTHKIPPIAPSFDVATDRGTVVDRSGYHQPDTGPRGRRRCGCDRTTSKGAYRDVTVDGDGDRVWFYHQTPVVCRMSDGTYRVDHGGYTTSTTKQRINEHTPSGFRVVQRDFDWYVDLPDGERVPFERGMLFDPADY